MSGTHGAAVLVAACAVVISWLPSHAAARSPSADTLGASTQQSARDSERLRILRDELGREQQVASDAARRKAERVAAADPRGASEADEALSRAGQNIDALKREIRAASNHATRSADAPRASASPARHRPDHAAATATAPRWWDVYARPSQHDEATATAAVQPLPVRPAQPGSRSSPWTP
ncbi:hypothetical protein BURK2_01075 [Burkholderiales bacterium]|nr:hypothetical protein BURK2_01075 [Burkholderiales bacterium]